MSSAKKLFLALLLLILGAAVLLGRQIQRSFAITTAPTNQPLVSLLTTDIPTDSTDPILGNPGAALSLVEFNDIGSTEGQRLHQILTDFVSAHPQEARLIWKDAPEQTIFLKDTVPAHRAAYCAHAQGKFWEYVGEISHNKKFASNTNLESAASDLKLNTLSWKNCFNNPTTEQKIQNSRILAKQLGITVTPVIFVNNKRLTLTKDIDLRQLLEAFIAP
jgi:protein-disulfide isomerase